MDTDKSNHREPAGMFSGVFALYDESCKLEKSFVPKNTRILYKTQKI